MSEREFRQSTLRRLASLPFLFGAPAFFVWAAATGPRLDAGSRGEIDFGAPGGKVFALVLAAAPFVCGIDTIIRLASSAPDVVLDATGIKVRRLFRSRRIDWADVIDVTAGTWSGPGSIPTLTIRPTRGRTLTFFPHRYANTTPDEVLQAIVEGLSRNRDGAPPHGCS